jgi:hypothetical protein
MCIPLLVRCHWPPATKFNLYLDSSLETVIREPTLYKLRMFHLMSIFLCLGPLSKKSIHVRGSLILFATNFIFYGEGLLAPRPTPKLEDRLLSYVRGCLFNIFAANLQSWRPSLPSATRGRAMLWWQGDPPNMASDHPETLNAIFVNCIPVCPLLRVVYVLSRFGNVNEIRSHKQSHVGLRNLWALKFHPNGTRHSCINIQSFGGGAFYCQFPLNLFQGTTAIFSVGKRRVFITVSRLGFAAVSVKYRVWLLYWTVNF